MRPIKLTMTAYGPYAGTEIVDFREAIASGLFGIYGSTGSGKSTIFSAMMFALFGKLSRPEQDPQSVRSDHAAPETLTRVEFIFEVCEKQYLIRRIPDQSRPKKNGDGETKETHKAWIFDVSDIDVDDITETNCGQIIMEKKVGLVQEVINDLLGYGAEQFRQIVLLPQGRFETFLTAKTDDRKKILRELFDVSLYRSIAQSFREKAQNAERTVQAERDSCAARLNQENFESTDALSDGIIKAEEQVSVATAEAKKAKAAEAKALKQKTDAEQIAQDFQSHLGASAEFARLTEKSADMTQQEGRLKSLKAAKGLEDLDNANVSADNEVTRAEGFLETAIDALQNAKLEKEAAGESLKIQKELEGEREAERKNAEGLKRHRPTLENAQITYTAWQAKRSEHETAVGTHAEAETKLEDISCRLEIAAKTREKAQENSVKRSELASQITKAEQLESATQAYERARKAVEEMSPKISALTAAATDAEAVFKAAETAFAQAEHNLAKAQAQHLASKLTNGEPCEVCGSLEHPNPANGTAESAGLDQAFRNARNQLETARNARDDVARTLATLENQKEDRAKAFSLLSQPTQSHADAKAGLMKLKSGLAALGAPEDLNHLKEQVDQLTGTHAQAKISVTKAKSNMDEAKTASLLAKQSYDSALSTIPEALRNQSKLETAIAVADDKYKASVKIFEAAQERSQKANEDMATKTAAKTAAEGRVKDAKDKHEKTQAEFDERLSASGISLEAYQQLKSALGEIDVLESNISTLKEALAVAKDRVKQAAEKIQDKDKPNIAGLITVAEAAEQSSQTASSELARTEARFDHLKQLQASLATEIEKISKMESETASLRELAALFNGSNSAKIELETYAIGAMFDQVLQAANLRLSPMTSGQYSFERALEGKGGGKRGLGINVHDVHTGKARATSTLSGGETFIAALSLALGLSDVVESTNGNIRLDTIFIDEGFGSLDTENDAGTLDQVLQTLQDLIGDHRAVGLISHVPLVQQAIPNGFSIRKTPSGSHVEMRSQ